MGAVMALLLISKSYAQETVSSSTPSATTSLSPAASRWELVQSPILARFMFKLDKFTGEVWQMVREEHGQSWERMYVEDAPAIKNL